MAKETKSRVVFQRSALGTRIALLVMLCVCIAAMAVAGLAIYTAKRDTAALRQQALDLEKRNEQLEAAWTPSSASLRRSWGCTCRTPSFSTQSNTLKHGGKKGNMEFTVGDILEGKVKSITNFGAFVTLPENRTGMVHISEVANTYVSDIRQHLTEGQDVKVMVIGNENGKINLSIKRLEPKPARENNRPRNNAAPAAPAAPKTADQLFEERLKQFMTESDSKISSIRQYSDHRTKSRRR